MTERMLQEVGGRHPMLMAAADQIFRAGGKRVRPALVLLVATAVEQMESAEGGGQISDRQRRLAEVTEMIHTASLVHDDVLDECVLRRGKETINSTYGSRVAVLVGDFLFARASWGLANLDNLVVIKLISQVIADFADGEIQQAQSLYDIEVTLDEYLDKSFFKTASLLAASCKSAAVLSGVSEEVSEAMFQYGKHLGLAFQVVDDVIDFTSSTDTLGKEAGQDLASGNITAPTIFALARGGDSGERLTELIEAEFMEDGDLEAAMGIVINDGGLEDAQTLAREQGKLAMEALECLPPSDARHSLEGLVDYVLTRIN